MVTIACHGSGEMGTNDKPHLRTRLSTGTGGIGQIEMDRVADYVSNVGEPAIRGADGYLHDHAGRERPAFAI